MKCGQPDAIYQETTRDGIMKEEWIYHRKELYVGPIDYILTFEQGNLIAITRD